MLSMDVVGCLKLEFMKHVALRTLMYYHASFAADFVPDLPHISV